MQAISPHPARANTTIHLSQFRLIAWPEPRRVTNELSQYSVDCFYRLTYVLSMMGSKINTANTFLKYKRTNPEKIAEIL